VREGCIESNVSNGLDDVRVKWDGVSWLQLTVGVDIMAELYRIGDCEILQRSAETETRLARLEQSGSGDALEVGSDGGKGEVGGGRGNEGRCG
jgi:hypothetical protein